MPSGCSRTPRRRRSGPVCGHTFDGVTCRKKGDHRCAPRAAHFLAFCRELLQHTKGDFARHPFEPADWQVDEIFEPLFGEVVWSVERRRYVRRYRTLYLNVARKNGKSFIVAAIMLYMLVADGEEEAELYGLALDKDQAGHVWRTSARMIELQPALSQRCQVVRSSGRIVDDPTASFFGIVAGDAAGALGANPHAVYIDELLTQTNRELYDAMRTGMGTRAQPLLILVTTAESDPTGFAATEREFSERLLEDPELDPTRLVVIHMVEKDADWTDEAEWPKANPGLGDYLSMQTLRDEYLQALNNPASERSLRQFRLNQPQSQIGRAIDLATWDRTAGLITETAFHGKPCFGGLDLASTSDLAAYALDFPDGEGGHDVIWRHFICEAQLADIDRRTGGQASVWARDGFLRVTDGDVIDLDAILLSIEKDAEVFAIQEIAYDRWGATQISQDLQKAGATITPMGQGFASMSPPTKELLRLIALSEYRHGGNPVARWQASNLVVRTDPSGNLKPDKEKSPEKIDGIVAGLMALDRAQRQPIKKKRRVASF